MNSAQKFENFFAGQSSAYEFKAWWPALLASYNAIMQLFSHNSLQRIRSITNNNWLACKTYFEARDHKLKLMTKYTCLHHFFLKNNNERFLSWMHSWADTDKPELARNGSLTGISVIWFACAWLPTFPTQFKTQCYHFNFWWLLKVTIYFQLTDHANFVLLPPPPTTTTHSWKPYKTGCMASS